jgi:hypothetical protein
LTLKTKQCEIVIAVAKPRTSRIGEHGKAQADGVVFGMPANYLVQRLAMNGS